MGAILACTDWSFLQVPLTLVASGVCVFLGVRATHRQR